MLHILRSYYEIEMTYTDLCLDSQINNSQTSHLKIGHGNTATMRSYGPTIQVKLNSL